VNVPPRMGEAGLQPGFFAGLYLFSWEEEQQSVMRRSGQTAPPCAHAAQARGHAPWQKSGLLRHVDVNEEAAEEGE
jgi:hypothetical protein